MFRIQASEHWWEENWKWLWRWLETLYWLWCKRGCYWVTGEGNGTRFKNQNKKVGIWVSEYRRWCEWEEVRRELRTEIGRAVTEHVKRSGTKGVMFVGRAQKANVCRFTRIWHGAQYSSQRWILCSEQKSQTCWKASYFSWLLVLTEDSYSELHLHGPGQR